MRRPRIGEGRLRARLREEQRRASGTERQEGNEKAGEQAALRCAALLCSGAHGRRICSGPPRTTAVCVGRSHAGPAPRNGDEEHVVVQRVVAEPRRSKFWGSQRAKHQSRVRPGSFRFSAGAGPAPRAGLPQVPLVRIPEPALSPGRPAGGETPFGALGAPKDTCKIGTRTATLRDVERVWMCGFHWIPAPRSRPLA